MTAIIWPRCVTKVVVVPMPAWMRKVPKRLRPSPPDVFPGGPPILADVVRARALFLQIDRESREWYSRSLMGRWFR